jgi:hypothetical protein
MTLDAVANFPNPDIIAKKSSTTSKPLSNNSG